MGKTHQSGQLPFFLPSLPNHLFCHKVVEVVISWKGKSMGKFELGKAPSFGMSCFACMDKKTPKPYASFDPCIHVFYLLSRFESWGMFWSVIHSPLSSFPMRVIFWVVGELFLCLSFTSANVFPLEIL